MRAFDFVRCGRRDMGHHCSLPMMTARKTNEEALDTLSASPEVLGFRDFPPLRQKQKRVARMGRE